MIVWRLTTAGRARGARRRHPIGRVSLRQAVSDGLHTCRAVHGGAHLLSGFGEAAPCSNWKAVVILAAGLRAERIEVIRDKPTVLDSATGADACRDLA